MLVMINSVAGETNSPVLRFETREIGINLPTITSFLYRGWAVCLHG